MLFLRRCNPLLFLSHRPTRCGAGLWAKCANLEPQCGDRARCCWPVGMPPSGLHAPAWVPIPAGARFPDCLGHLLQPRGNGIASYPQHFAADRQWEQHFIGPQQCLLWHPINFEARYRGRGVWGTVFHYGATPRNRCYPLGVQARLYTLQTLPTATLPPPASPTVHPCTQRSDAERTHPKLYRQVSDLISQYIDFKSFIADCVSNQDKTSSVFLGIPVWNTIQNKRLFFSFIERDRFSFPY